MRNKLRTFCIFLIIITASCYSVVYTAASNTPIANTVNLIIGDLDGDGNITSKDDTLLHNYIDKKIKHFPVESLIVSSVSDVDVAVNQGEKYNFPTSINAGMYDGSKKQVAVSWNSTKIDSSKIGKYTYEGTVNGYDKKVKLSVTVQKYIKSIVDINVNINQGSKYSLPSTVSAAMSDGSTEQVTIKWDKSVVDTSKIGKITYKGTIKGYSKPISLTVNVIAADYKLLKTNTFEITDIITVSAPTNAEFELEFNIGTSSQSPYQKELDIKAYGPGASITTTSDGRKKLVVKSSLKAGEKIDYKVIRKVSNSAIEYNTDMLSKTSGNYSNFSEYKKYTSPEENIESDNSQIVKKASEIFIGINNPYLKAKKAFEFVNTYMTYNVNSGNEGALESLIDKAGVCEDYSELLVALLRASGVPSRVVTGYWTEPEEFHNNVTDGSLNRHAWPEFYLPEYGWIVVEPTYTYTFNGKKTVNYDYFAKIANPSHIITGYDASGDNADSLVYWESYVSVDCEYETTIKKLN